LAAILSAVINTSVHTVPNGCTIAFQAVSVTGLHTATISFPAHTASCGVVVFNNVALGVAISA
jgi:tetrahydromethanopterin S-methyltransferase subunit D